MNSEAGIVYFVQPCELIGTDRYKIGCSSKSTLDRCISYHKGTRFININEVKNPFVLETKIKEEFFKKYKLIAGKEYFSGNEDEMSEFFSNLVNEHKKLKNNESTKNTEQNNQTENDNTENDKEEDKNDKEEDENENQEDDFCDTYIGFNNSIHIYNTGYFENFNENDPSLIIKIKIASEFSEDGYIIEAKNKYQYFIYDRYTVYVIRDLINKSKIEIEKEYDLFDKKFINLFSKYKKNIFDSTFERNYENYYKLMDLFFKYPFSLTLDNYFYTEEWLISELSELKIKFQTIISLYYTGVYNKDYEINHSRYINEIIEYIDKKLKDIEHLRNRKETDNKKIENPEKYKQSELIFFKKYQKINNCKNIIFKFFSLINVNHKYPVLLVDALNESLKKDKKYQFTLPNMNYNFYCYENGNSIPFLFKINS
jgi:hypothetical protein